MSEPTPYGSAPSAETKPVKPISLTTLFEMKTRGEKIAMLTCYDASFSALLDTQHIDCILVGDSLGNVIQGQRTTIPVQMSDMVYHTKAVLRGLYTRPTSRAWVVADMPFGSYGTTEDALHNAVKLMQAGAHMVKVEGGAWLADTVRTLVNNGIPVCAHMGLTPQSVYQLGGFKVQAKTEAAAEQLLKEALILQEAGASMLVLEAVPMHVGKHVTESVRMVTIGIGAGKDTDGQVLVLYDMLDVFPGKKAKFVKNFMAGKKSIAEAVAEYVTQVKSGEFPAPEHGFTGA
ncbi:MAG: 3-methyl-2-oxobutanoate hydroxymethyltransferase [Burkholderiales bacterium]|nr:3-methyl-2-oxobutanoate hydroxymethyltransferase [Burkholderiales bacterium]